MLRTHTCGQLRKEDKDKKKPAPTVDREGRLNNCGFKGKRREPPPSDLKIPFQGSEHVSRKGSQSLSSTAQKPETQPPGTEDNSLSSLPKATVIILFAGQSEPRCSGQPAQVSWHEHHVRPDPKDQIESHEKSPRWRHTKTQRWPIFWWPPVEWPA